MRQNKKNMERNYQIKVALRKNIRDYLEFVKSGKTEEARRELPKIYKSLDQAAQKNVIKKNAAARNKSRLAIKIAAKAGA